MRFRKRKDGAPLSVGASEVTKLFLKAGLPDKAPNPAAWQEDLVCEPGPFEAYKVFHTKAQTLNTFEGPGPKAILEDLDTAMWASRESSILWLTRGFDYTCTKAFLEEWVKGAPAAGRVADIGSGCGFISAAMAAMRSGIGVVSIEPNLAAKQVTEEWSNHLGVSARVLPLQISLSKTTKETLDGVVDEIVLSRVLVNILSGEINEFETNWGSSLVSRVEGDWASNNTRRLAAELAGVVGSLSEEGRLFAFETVGSTEMLVNIVGALSDNGLGFCKDESKFIKLDNPDNHPLWGSRPHIPLLVVVARKNLPVLTPMELVDWLGSMNPEDMAEGLVPDAVLASGREVVGKAVILPKEGELNSARCVEIRGSETDCWVLLTSSDGPGAFEHERGTKARNKLIKRWQTILDDALKQGYEVTRDF